ncbi:MAG: replication-associated recombination protein A [Clostridia bacterium]|nr:replication-associated recombination protein A [Clostridia bacterium]
MENKQLADMLRPTSFDDIVGQDHLFGKNGVVRKMIDGGRITNMIFFGPPGTGKTTASRVIASLSGMTFHKLNATTASLSDVKDVLRETGNMFSERGILLYIDEIQYFNRKQQQTLLEYIEDGRVTLIASTTENPHFYIHNAIISRSSLFEFKPVDKESCKKALVRALEHLNTKSGSEKKITPEALDFIARSTSGDVRRAIGLIENSFYVAKEDISEEVVEQFSSGVGNFDDGTHYDLLSCLQKSIRGSDPDAAVFYLARLLEAGELLAVCRRLQVIASEDVGLAYPMAAVIVRACVESARELGMPEARLTLANAAIMLATSPKSNSAHNAVIAATADVSNGLGTDVPTHLQAPLYKGYKYPHDYPNHYVKQQYLPNDVKNKTYYTPGENKTESAAAAYWREIKK